MAVTTLAILKTYFETGDFPTQSQFEDLIDTLGAGLSNPVVHASYIIGAPGVTGCDFNFTSVANSTRQNLTLATLPAKAFFLNSITNTTQALNSGTAIAYFTVTGAGDISTLNGAQTLDAITDSVSENSGALISPVFAAAVTMTFGVDPSANWNTLTTGKWKVDIEYILNT